MQGDFSRWTFDPDNAYRTVNMQQGRVLLDAEWNEQAQITAHHDEARSLDLIGRNGGALSEEAGPGPFAIVAADGTAPVNTAWSRLVVTPGRYYVDGVLAESTAPPIKGGSPFVGWPLVDQPHLATIDPQGAKDLGLPEPSATAGARYGVYLQVFDHHVTADERPSLRESALGGPDTTTRTQTVWQVRCVQLTRGETCSDLHDAHWMARTPRTMVAALRDADADPDPCRISSTGGYRRLENQLYRIQIHEPGDGTTRATFLWSRENGSVVAGLLDMSPSAVPEVVKLRVDRVGRDDELSVHQGDLVEVTSTDRILRGLPGFLATAQVPDGLDLPVAWLGDRPTSVDALGQAPVVRRWEGRLSVSTTAVDLEDGITVKFPAGGSLSTGDYWLIPARTVRLAYGVTELRGTIDWPVDEANHPVAAPPAGPVRHLAPLAVLTRSATGWTLEDDCRLLFPPVTGLVTLDLVGGDGQEALPGAWLDQPVRVVVRNGAVPVRGAAVKFEATSGGLIADAATAPPTPAGAPGPLTIRTGPDGVASVRWQLSSQGPTTQTLHVHRLDDHGNGIDVEVGATARLSVATQVAWSHDDCPSFERVTTVGGALDRLVERPELRLQGGDGQHLPVGDLVLPRPVRILVDSACGPLAGVPVDARATGQAQVQVAEEGEERPPDLQQASAVAEARTTSNGGALFWWQPDVSSGSDVLEIRLPGEDPHAPLVVSAQASPSTQRAGIHITRLSFGNGTITFENDSVVNADVLNSGINVSFDGNINVAAVNNKPVARVEVELPWPFAGDGHDWTPGASRSAPPLGTRTVTLAGHVHADNRLLRWEPGSKELSDWLTTGIWSVLAATSRGVDTTLLCRFCIEGWAIPSDDKRRLQVNTHAQVGVQQGRTVVQLPTDDAVTGGTFVQWFQLHRTPPPPYPYPYGHPFLGVGGHQL